MTDVPVKRVALFWDPKTHYNDRITQNDKIIYAGQLKRKTMDNYFNRANTQFFIFKKDNRMGWRFMGQATVVQRMKDRVHDKQAKHYVAPLWEMRFENEPTNNRLEVAKNIDIYHAQASCPTYLTKVDLFELILGCSPKIQSISTGIIPFG